MSRGGHNKIDLTPCHDLIVELHASKGFGTRRIAAELARHGIIVGFKTVKAYLKTTESWNPRQIIRLARKPTVCVLCSAEFLTRSIGKYCKICVPDKRSLAMWKLYGITRIQYETTLAAQQGQCAICSRVLSSLPTKQVHIDHDHRSNRFRGILCAKCNNGLGFIERPDFLDQALTYLRQT